ncbi:MAG: protein kinase domain-containing protein [Thermodesulfobacteriota bacterium]
MLSKLINKITGKSPAEASRPPVEPSAAKRPAPQASSPGGKGLPSIPEWEKGDTILNRYRVEEVMSGAMGKVYICEHLGWGIKVAIKSPRPEVLADREGMKRILKEANSWVRMGMHPNVASCYYVLGIHRVPHLFIEYIDGGNLSDWIKSGRCKNPRTALTLAIQFCHGMEFTHHKGIIHRDIKPANILVTKNSLVKITDFGIVLTHDEEGSGPPDIKGGDTDNPEATVGFRGTIGYASPEQLRDAHAVDRRTDIFSFGLCLWLMFCGRKPFTDNSARQPIPEPAPLPGNPPFPPSLREVLIKSVAFNPEDRYPSFAEMRASLNRAYQEAFKTSCPYAELTDIDLRADGLNNRAVSLAELGEVEEALLCLQKTLDINDLLPEAVYNSILLNWRGGRRKPSRILRQIETAKKRGITAPWLDELANAVKRGTADEGAAATAQPAPELRLCLPKNSLEIFREAQLHISVKRNLQDHLHNKRYSACHDILMTAWQHQGFRKDAVFNRVYDSLLPHATSRQKVVGVQRFLTIKGVGTAASHLACLPESKCFFSAHQDGRLIQHDLTTPAATSVLSEAGSPITALALCPLGKHLAVGSQDGFIRIFSPKTGKQESRENAHSGAVYSLAFSPDGKHLASGGADGIMKLRRLGTGPQVSISVREAGAVRSLLYAGKDLRLVSGSEDGTIRLWSAGGDDCTRIIEAHAMPVVALANAANGQRFASASGDRRLKIWEHATGRCIKEIKAHEEAITSALFLPDSQTIACGCEDDLISLWNAEYGDGIAMVDARGDGVVSLAQGPRSHTFLAGRKDGAIILWVVIYQLLFG